jgi:tetratricopeptide (TPR) repeat protein
MPKQSRSRELLEFEINFYERLLEDHPRFVDALMALGETYTRRGWHDKGLEVDRQLTTLKPHEPVVWYNLACSLALLKRHDESLDAIRQAIALGYDDFGYLLKDPDLSSLRPLPKFRRLLEAIGSGSAPAS